MVDPDGTGTITVTAEADAELVSEVPTLAEELVLDDIAEAGWKIDGPTATASGGLLLILTHDFEGKDEATNCCAASAHRSTIPSSVAVKTATAPPTRLAQPGVCPTDLRRSPTTNS